MWIVEKLKEVEGTRLTLSPVSRFSVSPSKSAPLFSLQMEEPPGDYYPFCDVRISLPGGLLSVYASREKG